MAEQSTGGGGGAAPIFIFFAFIVLLAFYSFSGEGGERRTIFNNDSDTNREVRGTSGGSSISNTTQTSKPKQLSEAEIERRIAKSFRELDSLEQDVRTAIIWGNRSPLENQVTLSRGNVSTTDHDREYLVIRANSRNKNPVDISGWLIESYVTEEGATIPFGTRLYQKGRVNTTAPLLLEPGETAYVITGESPVGVSFHENKCTGYLAEFQSFTPSLTRSCPSARGLFEELFFTNDSLYFDDACYDYMRTISRCEIVDLDELDATTKIGAGCKRFVEREFNYDQCYARNVHRPFFDDGQWYIYLGRTDELWKSRRDILRLLDRNRETVDVVEY